MEPCFGSPEMAARVSVGSASGWRGEPVPEEGPVNCGPAEKPLKTDRKLHDRGFFCRIADSFEKSPILPTERGFLVRKRGFF